MSNRFLFGKKKDFFWVSPQFTGWFGPILRHKFSTQSIFNLHIAPFLLYFVPNLSKNKSLQFASIELFQFGPSVFLTFNDFHLFWWDLQESESAKLLFTASHFYLSIVLSHCNFWVTSMTSSDLKTWGSTSLGRVWFFEPISKHISWMEAKKEGKRLFRMSESH